MTPFRIVFPARNPARDPMTTLMKALLTTALILGSAANLPVAENDPIPHCFPCPQSR
jgi:hypothetical protein